MPLLICPEMLLGRTTTTKQTMYCGISLTPNCVTTQCYFRRVCLGVHYFELSNEIIPSRWNCPSTGTSRVVQRLGGISSPILISHWPCWDPLGTTTGVCLYRSRSRDQTGWPMSRASLSRFGRSWVSNPRARTLVEANQHLCS